MGNIGDTITETIPAVGSTGTTYATDLDLFLTEVKDRLEALVPRDSLDEGALDMNGFPVQNASYFGLVDAAEAPTTPSNTLQAFDGELYWVSAGGAVQITDGTNLNTALMGGITGDYGGANPAQFRFVDADQEYYAYDDYAGGAWARVWAKNFDIAAGATSANRVRLSYSGGGSYTLALPPTLPVSSAILQMSSSGAVTADNTLGITLSVVDLKLAGIRERVCSTSSYRDFSAVHTHTVGASWLLGNSTQPLVVPLLLDVGDRITGVTVYINKGSDATNTLTARLEEYSTSGAQTVIATATNSSNAPGAVTLAFSTTTTIVTGKGYIVRIFQSDSTPSGNDIIYTTSVSYDRP